MSEGDAIVWNAATPIVALLGRRDVPTDALEDYCIWLGNALSTREHRLERVRVPWREQGWFRALRRLWGQSAGWRTRWVLVQYTALGWSQRGFSFGLLGVLAVLRWRSCRVAVVFHDATGFPGGRWIDRVRRASQEWIMRMAYRAAERTIHTVPVDRAEWLPRDPVKASFIPVGANVPAVLHRGRHTVGGEHGAVKRVAVFGVTVDQRGAREIADIAFAVNQAARKVSRVQLVVFGRGSQEAEAALRRALDGSAVELSVLGLLPAEEISGVLARADVLLCVRGPLSSERGSGIAGIACGLPIVGYTGPLTAPPLTEAGVALVADGAREALTDSLCRLLSVDQLWDTLHQRSVRAYHRYFCWDAIADRFTEALCLRRHTAIASGESPANARTHGCSFEEMQPAHARAIARLHARYIQDSFMSALGEEFLAAVYHGLLEFGSGVGYVMIRRGEIVGFSFGRSSHRSSLLRVAVRARRRLSVPALRLLYRRPLALLQAMAGLIQPGPRMLVPGVGELMSIAMTEDARGSHESQKIAMLLFERLRQEGCHTVRWETLGHNVRARRYYAKIGGRIIKVVRARKHRVLWFEKHLY